MESKDELKEIDIKSRTCYCFDDIMQAIGIYSGTFYQTKNYMKIFQFMTFHTKLLWIQTCCAFGWIKQMDLLKFMMELDIQYYYVIAGMMKFMQD